MIRHLRDCLAIGFVGGLIGAALMVLWLVST